ncbi:unnamed protein product [Paramecium sonneborni]|uniref:Transmembrane protein n=1 Tax=Paramecium sonneborni TaxID=65129 RepID=A0A8S1Q1T8_9CILI|nr:unnamed protein product [Paramecium sonneborni]
MLCIYFQQLIFKLIYYNLLQFLINKINIGISRFTFICIIYVKYQIKVLVNLKKQFEVQNQKTLFLSTQKSLYIFYHLNIIKSFQSFKKKQKNNNKIKIALFVYSCIIRLILVNIASDQVFNQEQL